MLASLLCKGAPYTVPISPTAFDYGAAYVSLIAKTRASLRDWQQHATTYVTVGALNISSKVESPVFRAYPLARLANVSDGIFIMSYDMNKGHATCAGPNSPINLLREYVGGYIGAGASPDKLILGIPWYGRQYFCNGSDIGVGGGLIGGSDAPCAHSTCICGSAGHYAPYEGILTMWEVRQKLQDVDRAYNCTRSWNAVAGSPAMDCPATATMPRSQTWYDDANSTRLKVALADELNLGALGLFSGEMAGDLNFVDGTDVAEAWAAISEFKGRPRRPVQGDRPPAADSADRHDVAKPAAAAMLAKHSGSNGSGTVFNVRTFGAVGDNTTYDTAAVRTAAAALKAAGGGTLIFPAGGTYLTGAFNLSSHSIVLVEAGATIVGSPRVEDWPLVEPMPYFGWGSMNQGLVYAVGAVNITLTGGGTIDGLDQPWYPTAPKLCTTAPPCAGVHLILIRDSSDVVVQNLRIIRSRNWALHFAWATNVRVANVDVDIDGGDGIDLTCVQTAIVEDSTFSAYKDALGVKSGVGEAGRLYGRPTRDVLFRNLKINRGHGISIGDEISAGIQNVTFDSIWLNGTRAGPRIKSKNGIGGWIDTVTYRNITGIRMGAAPAVQGHDSYGALPEAFRDIDIDLVWAGTGGGNTTLSNVVFDGIHISGGPSAGVFVGTATSPIINVTMRNVKLGDGSAPTAPSFSNCTFVENGVCLGDVYPCPPCFVRRSP